MSRFLLVSLSIETILAEPTIHRRKEKLKQISKGQDFGDVYTTTFERIMGQENARSRLGMEAIMWIAYSERPLQPDELCQALGVEVGSKDMKEDNAPTMQTIMNCALGFITVDSSSSTVRLVHFTLQEYILLNHTLFQSPDSLIGEACLTYLNFECIWDLSPSLSSPPSTTPFLDYASCHWGAHVRREISESARPLVLRLLDRFDAHISCKILLLKEYETWQPFDAKGYPIGFTGLHGAAFLRILELICSLFDLKKWELNATEFNGRTALSLAVGEENARDVKVLLEQVGLDPDIADNRGRTPLSWAAFNCMEEAVRLLLARKDVSPDTPDETGRTPLSWAAVGWGNDDFSLGRTNLGQDFMASGSECAVVARLLLERSDVNPDRADKTGRTPLSWAASYGREEVVEMLLERSDVTPNTPDERGRTPFSWAVMCGNVEAAETLLERDDVRPDAADNTGRTPLSWAAIYGYHRAVKILLQRSDVNLNSADGRRQTPLSLAAEHRSHAVVEILLERMDVNPNAVDLSGRTPLSWAAFNCMEETVRLLLARTDVNPNTPDEMGRTPLSWAAFNCMEETVRLLLARNDVNPDTPDGMRRTPLSWAAMGWGTDPGGIGRTNLGQDDMASGSECAMVAELLLERSDVNPDRADKSGRTPLSWAASYGREEMVKMLLERNDVSPDRPDYMGWTPFWWAVKYGNTEVAETLLDRDDVNPDAADARGLTPLSWASSEGHEEIVKMLLKWKDVNPNPADPSGRTPFPRAIENACTRVAQLVESPYDLTDRSALGGLCEPFTADPLEIPEPPSKRVRRH